MFNTGKVSPEFIVLDVSGVSYRLMKKRTRRFQSSLFYRLLSGGSTSLGFGNPEIVWLAPNKFFVQRSPALFDIVLQYYISGKLHLPTWACKEAIAEELAFWKLKPEHLCSVCCDKEHYDEDDDNISSYDEVVRNGAISNGNLKSSDKNERRKTVIINKWQTFKYRLWAFCERPRSSKAALIFMIVSMVFIMISTLNLIVGSIPNLQYCPPKHWKQQNFTATNGTNGTRELLEENEKNPEADPDDLLFGFQSSCIGTRVFEWIDLICIIYFTIEIIVRFVACPTVRQFFTTPMHILDILATIPYHIELIIWAIDRDNHLVHKASTLLFLLLVLRNLRVLRVLKLARYSRGLRALAITLKAAKRELFLLFSVLLLCVIIFSSIMYQLEKDVPNSSFNSIPATGWWSIGTITLVGFGDMAPKTTGGKVVASCMCVIGIMIVAFPISVFVEHFTAAYKNQATLSILKRGKNPAESTLGDESEFNHSFA